ncbi:MAG: FCD domain-containing protein [Pseudomonadota bacterium]
MDEPKRTGRAADAIIERIEDDIAQGVLADGDPLPSERALMQHFGASRSVVREAITALTHRGLVRASPRHRPRVQHANADALLGTTAAVMQQLLSQPGGAQNVYQTRVFIERGLVRQATLSASHEDLTQLRTALAANQDAIGDAALFFQTDIDFHGVLYAITGNPIFTALHRGLTQWLEPHWSRMPRAPEHDQANYLAHEAIYTAILQRNPDEAEAALTAHLDTAWRLVRETIDTQG